MMDKNIIVLSFLLMVAVWFDLRERRIPNALIVVGLAFGLTLAAVDGGLDDLGFRLLGAFAGLGVLFPFFALRVLGAGDAKLMAVVGSFTGAMPLLPITLYTFIAGGILALLAFAITRSAGTAFSNFKILFFATSLRMPVGLHELGLQSATRLPYAIAIAAGVGCWAITRG